MIAGADGVTRGEQGNEGLLRAIRTGRRQAPAVRSDVEAAGRRQRAQDSAGRSRSGCPTRSRKPDGRQDRRVALEQRRHPPSSGDRGGRIAGARQGHVAAATCRRSGAPGASRPTCPRRGAGREAARHPAIVGRWARPLVDNDAPARQAVPQGRPVRRRAISFGREPDHIEAPFGRESIGRLVSQFREPLACGRFRGPSRAIRSIGRPGRRRDHVAPVASPLRLPPTSYRVALATARIGGSVTRCAGQLSRLCESRQLPPDTPFRGPGGHPVASPRHAIDGAEQQQERDADDQEWLDRRLPAVGDDIQRRGEDDDCAKQSEHQPRSAESRAPRRPRLDGGSSGGPGRPRARTRTMMAAISICCIWR